MIHVKVGVTCDDYKHVGEKSEVLLDAELSADGLVRAPTDQNGWSFVDFRYDSALLALCPACTARKKAEYQATLALFKPTRER